MVMRLENPENQDLTGKVVILAPDCYQGDQAARRFRCAGGFGCKPFTRGKAIFGEFLIDGEKGRVERYEIEAVEV